MSSLHPARRGAERFDSLLRGEPGAATSTRNLELLEVVGALQALPRPEPRAAFTADLRERLMLAAQTELVPAGAQTDAAFRDMTDRLTVRTRRTPRERRVAIALGGFAMVGATTSMAVAAQHALPGDILYPLKRAMENAEAGFSADDSAKGTTILQNATGRLDEVRSLSLDTEVDAETVTETLNAFTEQVTEASELLIADYQTTGAQAPINELRDFAAESIETLAALQPLVPESAEEALLEAAQLILSIDGQAAFLCPECSSLGIFTVPTQLLGNEVESAPAPAPAQPAAPVTGKDKGKGGNGRPAEGRGNAGDSGQGTTEAGEPVDIPAEEPSQQGGDFGPNPGGKGPQVTLPTELPSIDLSNPGATVSEVTSDVGEVVEGLLGNKTEGK